MKIDTLESNLKLNKEKKVDSKYQNAGIDFQDLLENGCTSLREYLNYIDNEEDFTSTSTLLSTMKDDISSLKASYKYDCLSMDRDDAMFFANSIRGENYNFTVNGELLMQNLDTSVESVAKTYKSAEVSKVLMNMLSESQSTNKPVRIDFGNDISAILRVSHDGKISAEFIPSDKIAEEYLKNNISYLQQTFNEKDIPYNELAYRSRNGKNKQNNENNQKNKGEN